MFNYVAVGTFLVGFALHVHATYMYRRASALHEEAQEAWELVSRELRTQILEERLQENSWLN